MRLLTITKTLKSTMGEISLVEISLTLLLKQTYYFQAFPAMVDPAQKLADSGGHTSGLRGFPHL